MAQFCVLFRGIQTLLATQKGGMAQSLPSQIRPCLVLHNSLQKVQT